MGTFVEIHCPARSCPALVAGLTGKLIAARVHQLGLPATLAGRNAGKLEKLHEELQLPVEAFELTDREKLGEVVGRHKVVLHVAGVSDTWQRRMTRGSGE